MNFSRTKISAILAVCVVGIVFVIPNLLPQRVIESFPSWVPSHRVNLGLDLQGGAQLLLEIDTAAVQRERLNGLLDSVRSTLRTQRIQVANLAIEGTDTITLRVRDPAQVETARQALRDIDRAAQVGSAAADGTITIRYNPQELIEQRRQAIVQTIEILRRRLDESGTKEVSIAAQGQNRILVQLPGEKNPERIKTILGTTAKMNFHLLDVSNSVADAMAGRVPPGDMLLPADKDVDATGQKRMYLVERRVMVAGDRLKNATPGTNPQTGEWIVNFEFDNAGGRQFGEVTRQNVGRNLAIVLDNKVISAPTIREPILGGRGQISGSFSAASAQDLAVLLRAGALPAPLKIVEERTVGPELGADSIKAGLYSVIAGFLLVVGYMTLAYGLFGVFANVALIVNLALIIAVMSMLNATLTLPGIAGILLTLGMSVDANVLINERMREEVRNGRTPLSAINTGFSRAMATIVDANLTTLIKMVILFALGSGPVRGFAVTISLGIITSMFTATMLVRLIIMWWYGWQRPKTLPV
jgi:protein-export membrane protein SecD